MSLLSEPNPPTWLFYATFASDDVESAAAHHIGGRGFAGDGVYGIKTDHPTYGASLPFLIDSSDYSLVFGGIKSAGRDPSEYGDGPALCHQRRRAKSANVAIRLVACTGDTDRADDLVAGHE